MDGGGGGGGEGGDGGGVLQSGKVDRSGGVGEWGSCGVKLMQRECKFQTFSRMVHFQSVPPPPQIVACLCLSRRKTFVCVGGGGGGRGGLGGGDADISLSKSLKQLSETMFKPLHQPQHK